ncbi:MAG: CheR family methyltransferase, partial [Actinomycetota bacterium]
PQRPKPSVDLLLRSAAGSFGERLIAVILSGTGTDGAEGARIVHAAGGTVIVQNPETAEFAQMPASLAPNAVDIVADLPEIGRILGELVSSVEMPAEDRPPDEGRALERLLEYLRERHGVDFGGYKRPTIRRRLARRMVAVGAADIEEYRRYLETHPEEYRQLVNSFLIKVTEFFRDPELFEYLRQEVLPLLIEEARREGRSLRIWSAGCATGEEAYSLAMLVSELLGDEAGFFDVRIFATDLDEDAVNFARRGVYPEGALAGLSEEQVRRYFVEEDGQYQVKKQVRGMIVFGEHDLARRSPFPRIDLVMSRNVLIYFSPELQRRALLLFAYSLRDGGYLVLGGAETASPAGDLFEQRHRQHKVYVRKGERFLMPPTVPVSPAPPRMERPDGPRFHAVPGPQGEEHRPRVSEEGFLSQVPVGLVVVDRNYDVRAINAAARGLLQVHGAAVGEDLLHSLPEEVPYAEVRRAIDAAFREGEAAATGEIAIQNAREAGQRYLRLVCYPRRVAGDRGPAGTVMIVVQEVTGAVATRKELEGRLEELRTESERLRRESEAEATRQRLQNERLLEANRRLEEANRELTRINEDLQSSYEDALLSTEEAQAATEEVETLNEELQATNEELETLNEELQATVEELNATNEDLQARGTELQELARKHEEERREAEKARMRLEAILSGISDAVLAVGFSGEVLFSNEIFRRTFGDGEPGDPDAGRKLGRLLPLDEEGRPIPQEQTPQARASRGETFEMRFAARAGGGLRRFEARGRPIDAGDTAGGVVVIRELPEG